MGEVDRISHERERAPLPPPVVSPSVYDGDYYLHRCAGAEEWAGSEGAHLSGLYAGSLIKARLRQGDVVVDLGTGRGELLAVAVEMGAAQAIGVEYSFAALQFAAQTMAKHGTRGRASVVLADSRRLPLPARFADLVVMLDIVEHLGPSELDVTFREALRVLRPGGRLFAHTFPTKTVYDVTYRVQRCLWPGRWRRWPADPRLDVEHVMHINEQTKSALSKALRKAGFSSVTVERGKTVHDTFVPDERARRLYHLLASNRFTAGLGAADLWAEATRRS